MQFLISFIALSGTILPTALLPAPGGGVNTPRAEWESRWPGRRRLPMIARLPRRLDYWDED